MITNENGISILSILKLFLIVSVMGLSMWAFYALQSPDQRVLVSLVSDEETRQVVVLQQQKGLFHPECLNVFMWIPPVNQENSKDYNVQENKILALCPPSGVKVGWIGERVQLGILDSVSPNYSVDWYGGVSVDVKAMSQVAWRKLDYDLAAPKWP